MLKRLEYLALQSLFRWWSLLAGECFLRGRDAVAGGPMKGLSFFEGSDADFLAFDIETYSPNGFPFSMEDPVVNFSLVTPWKGGGVLAVSMLAEPRLEGEVLKVLNRLLANFRGSCLLTYNGSRFDLEYVSCRGRLYGLSFEDVFGCLRHLDVYKLVKWLNIRSPAYSQKSVERFLGIRRVVTGVDGVSYHLSFEDFLKEGSLEAMFYNLEDCFGCLRIADFLLRRMGFGRKR